MKRTTHNSKTVLLAAAGLLAGAVACRQTRSDAQLAGPFVLERTGGLAGAADRIRIEQNGEYEVFRREASVLEGQLSPDAVGRLAVLANQSGRFANDRELRADGADLFTYTFEYAGHAVSATDHALEPWHREVLDLLVPLLR